MIKQTFQKVFNNKVDALGLSLFRMFYSVILLCEIAQLFKFRNIIYDKVPFIYMGEINMIFVFGFWAIILLLLFFGLFTRFATIGNYIFGIIIFSSASNFEYHVFYTYVGVNFYMMFLPMSRVFSLDSLIQKIKYTDIGRPYIVDRKILEINYLIPVFIGIAIIYFDSIFLKLQNNLWTSGLGIWLPSSLPMVALNDMSFILNQKELIIFLGYFVLVFEALFVFLFWFTKWRVPLMIIGVFFHLGIMVCYPIPFFALTFVIIYLLLVPLSFWLKMSNMFKSKRILYTFYYDAECPLCNKTVVAIRHFDVFNTVRCLTVQGNHHNEPALQSFPEELLLINIHGVANGRVYVGYWAYVQLMKSLLYTYPFGLLMAAPGISHLGQRVYRYIAGERLTTRCTEENCTLPVFNKPLAESEDIVVKGCNRLAITKRFWKINIITLFILQCLLIGGLLPSPISASIKKCFGVTRHAVFLDFHFEGFNHIFKVVHVDKQGQKNTVPILDENGMPAEYNSGVTWRNISFNVITSKIKQKKLESGIIPYLQYYLQDHGYSPDNAHFEFYAKEIDTPHDWEKDFLHNQMKKPWLKVGIGNLHTKNHVVFEWNDTMRKIIESEK